MEMKLIEPSKAKQNASHPQCYRTGGCRPKQTPVNLLQIMPVRACCGGLLAVSDEEA
jgi:hypothetical protein